MRAVADRPSPARHCRPRVTCALSPPARRPRPVVARRLPACHRRPPAARARRRNVSLRGEKDRGDLYRSVREVRTGPTGYRYVDRPLPGDTVESRVSPRRHEVTPRLPARDEARPPSPRRNEVTPTSPLGTRRRLVSPRGTREQGTRRRLPSRENEVTPLLLARENDATRDTSFSRGVCHWERALDLASGWRAARATADVVAGGEEWLAAAVEEESKAAVKVGWKRLDIGRGRRGR
ncbi:hypothetical protein GW17_00002219 [Ensete ventricosum]|nr:hypothetical protein GW17_00002219 [Ensete ventricosum]